MTSIDDEINWENLLNFDDVVENFNFSSAAPTTVYPPSPPSHAAATAAAQLEDILLKDDDDNGGGDQTMNDDYLREFDFNLSDLLLDTPGDGGELKETAVEAAEVVVGEKNSPFSTSSVGNCGLNFMESNCEDDKSGDGDGDGDGDDPLSKKRKRQLRNRDAAMRSRERKKKFVKELEMKSRYYEEECRRLGRLLSWCYAENQMLRISLQTYGAPMTKPESAVLSLESLLLGSLVWLMVNICLLPQPKLPLLNQCAAKLVGVDRNGLGSATPRGKGTKISEPWISVYFMRSRRCRASRTKMKPHSDVLCL